MKKKLDLEAKIHIFCWKLKVQEEKKYSDDECDKYNILYNMEDIIKAYKKEIKENEQMTLF